MEEIRLLFLECILATEKCKESGLNQEFEEREPKTKYADQRSKHFRLKIHQYLEQHLARLRRTLPIFKESPKPKQET